MLKSYYSDSAVTMYCGDCRDILPQIEAVDHVITDPPYEAEAHQLGRRAFSGQSDAKHPKGIAEERPLDFAAITDEDRKLVGGMMARLSSGWVLVFCQVGSIRVYVHIEVGCLLDVLP